MILPGLITALYKPEKLFKWSGKVFLNVWKRVVACHFAGYHLTLTLSWKWTYSVHFQETVNVK